MSGDTGETDFVDLSGNGDGVAFIDEDNGDRGDIIVSGVAGVNWMIDPNAPIILNKVRHVATRATLAASTTTSPIYLTEAGREGAFVWDASNLQAKVTADTLQGIYVPPTGQNGSTGAWVRTYNGPADVRWFGATLASLDNSAAIQAALTVAGYIRVPAGIFTSKGGIVLPTGAFLTGPGTINFDASAATYLFSLGANNGTVDVSDVTIFGVTFTSTSDVGFMHLVRLSNTAGTLDNFRFLDNRIKYTPATGPGAGDRWVIGGSGNGTRTNFEIAGNYVSGPMQLTGTPFGNGTAKHWRIHHNKIYNARVAAISLLVNGTIGFPNLLEDIEVTDNEIWADANTGIGIVVGIDSSTPDLNVAINRLLIARNRINIAASAAKTSDIYIRLGNKCANIAGFDSTADSIVIDSNELHYGMAVTQTTPVTASGLSRAANFHFKSNIVYQGDVILSCLETGASLADNMFHYAAALRLSIFNGRIESTNNIYPLLINLTNDAEFDLYSVNDRFFGSTNGTDRVITFNANAGKVQTATFINPTIDSYTALAFGKRSAIYTLGAGNPTVVVKGFRSTTAWGFGRYEATTGTITEVNDFGAAISINGVTSLGSTGILQAAAFPILTGDVTTAGGSLATSIGAGKVTLAMQANMATASVVYRKSAGAGAPEVQTLATLKTDLGLTGTNSGDQTSIVGITGTLAQFNTAITDADIVPTGLVTASGLTMSTGKLLGRTTAATGAVEELSTLPAANFPILTGDITTAGGTLATALGNNVVTYAKFQQIGGTSVMGNPTGSIANAQTCLIAGGLGYSGTTLTINGAINAATSIAIAGAITSSGGGIGYVTGAGGTVAQATSKATGVTLDKLSGDITLNAAALAASTTVSFVLTNNKIAAGDIVVLTHSAVGTFGSYVLNAHGFAAGSCTIDVRNVSLGSLSEAIVIRFVVIKAAQA